MPIDFVLLWVDSQDETWLEEKNKYAIHDDTLNGDERYRDYGTLKYWFRMVATNAPWVNHIFLVTDNQIPEWLNQLHPKLTIVRHADFMPADTLPTFNSNAIQMYIHKIKGLSEHFVLFDDDMFINQPIKPSVFFTQAGTPRDILGFNVINPVDQFAHLFVNNLALVNQNHQKKDLLRQHFFKLFNWRYGVLNILNLYLLPWRSFTRFFDPHLPYAYLKSEYQMVMTTYSQQRVETGQHRFREISDISHWLVRYERLVTGNFSPMSRKIGALVYLGDPIPEQKALITISDKSLSRSQFELRILKIRQYFRNKYSKSDFEK